GRVVRLEQVQLAARHSGAEWRSDGWPSPGCRRPPCRDRPDDDPGATASGVDATEELSAGVRLERRAAGRALIGLADRRVSWALSRFSSNSGAGRWGLVKPETRFASCRTS